jgi:predicted RNA-binding Zn-ribbon protein involved in translation (DUF1610 family)
VPSQSGGKVKVEKIRKGESEVKEGSESESKLSPIDFKEDTMEDDELTMEEALEQVACPQCGGEPVDSYGWALSRNHTWYRCRNCGWDFIKETTT